MAAKIDGDTGATTLQIGATSKAASATLYDPSGREVLAKPRGSYLVGFLWRQTAASVANSTQFAIANTDSTIVLQIRALRFIIGFDGTAPGAQGRGYGIHRTSGAVATAGTQLTPTLKRSADPASVADVRFLDTGLTTTGQTIQGYAAFNANLSVDTTSRVQSYEYQLMAPGRRTSSRLGLRYLEGVSFRNSQTALVGVTVSGYIEWDEELV